MNIVFKPIQNETKLLEVSSSVSGYWDNDIWDINNPIFDELIDNVPKTGQRFINFSSFPSRLKNEVKFFILSCFESKSITSVTVIKNYCSAFKHVADFLEKYYSSSYSFVEINIDKALIQLRSFLIDGNIKLRNQLPKSRFTRYETLLKQLYNFYVVSMILEMNMRRIYGILGK